MGVNRASGGKIRPVAEPHLRIFERSSTGMVRSSSGLVKPSSCRAPAAPATARFRLRSRVDAPNSFMAKSGARPGETTVGVPVARGEVVIKRAGHIQQPI
jgi:hypothetical protein